MVQPFEVTGEAAAAEEPEAVGTAVLRDFSFELPTELAAGPQIWKVTNEGPEPHELALLQLAPGMTADQALAMLAAMEAPATPGAEPASPVAAGPPPVRPDRRHAGADDGPDRLASARSGTRHLPGNMLRTQPGNGGQPHVAGSGMFAEFTDPAS